jgi:hypothetical protein
METDIYAFIEYKTRGTYRDWARPTLPRNKTIFACLACGDGGTPDDLQYPPRGLPAGYSATIADAFFMDGDDAREIAEQVGVNLDINDYPDWAKLEYVESGCFPNPNWHTPSWLTLSELELVLAQCVESTGVVPPEYQAITSAMRSLADAYGRDNVRLVFWFG